MSTRIPLTVIEGAMAMPRLQPLGSLHVSFGNEWTLLPPNISLRRELKALYAAVLRTFCLSVVEVRSLCRWGAKREQPATPAASMNDVGVMSDVGAASHARHADVPSVNVQPAAGEAQRTATRSAIGTSADIDARPTEPVQRTTEAKPFEAGDVSPLRSAPRDARLPLSALAGGACAIGGAAVLAWLAFGHPAQRQTAVVLSTPDRRSLNDSERLASRRSATTATASERGAAVPHSSSHDSLSASVASARPTTRIGDSISVPRLPAQPAARLAPPHRAARLTTLPKRTAKLSQVAGDSTFGRHSRHHDAAHLPHVGTVQATVPLPSARPSAAGAYSPFAPSMLGNDEYASITMSAGTHLRDMAPAPRAGSAAAPRIDTNSTDWMNRMSQRRVTDVPDQFSK